MAAATVTVTAPAATQRLNNPLVNPTFIPVTITGVATVYATATGGLPFDLFQVLVDAGNPANPINYKDILGFIGSSNLGYLANGLALGTATASTLPATIRLWNGATESAEAANSQVITGFLILARGGTN